MKKSIKYLRRRRTSLWLEVTSIKEWILSNKLEFFILVLILSVGAFFRLYKIDQYMTFLGDEGRDAIIVRKLLLGDLVFVGPGTSIGNMYLGPIYYYLMAPALFLAKFNPVGPSIMIALFGMATILFTWFIIRKWFGKIGATAAAFLYAISPVVIIFSKHSWNPNVMPFFALLTIYSLWKVWVEHKWQWLWVLGFAYAIVLQSHYLGFILFPLLVLFCSLTLRDLYINKKGNWKLEIRKFLRNSLVFLIVLAGLLSPLIMFDAKHNWGNLKSMKSFILERQGSISFNPALSIEKVYPTWQLMITRLLTGKEIWLGRLVSIILLVFIGFILYKIIEKKLPEITQKAFIFLMSWLLVGLIGLSFLNGEIYDHYFEFLFPAPFILLGFLVENIVQRAKRIGQILIFLALGLLFYANLANSPLKAVPGRQMQNTIEVARKIQDKTQGKRYNFAVIADRNYEGAYQYFLELWNTQIVMINPQRYSDTLTDQLFVVCEYEDKTKCQPASNPKAEIANFGWSKIDESWVVDGVILFRMIHNWPYE